MKLKNIKFVIISVALTGCVTLSEMDISMMSDKEVCSERAYIVNTPITKYDEASESRILDEIKQRGIKNCDPAYLVCAREPQLQIGSTEYAECHLAVREQEAKRLAEQAKIDAEK